MGFHHMLKKENFNHRIGSNKISKFDVLKWQKERKVVPPKIGYSQFAKQMVVKPDFTQHNDAVWWLGHSTVLIKLSGKTIITDPIFSERASPVQFAGPKRLTPPPCDISDLPQIDAIIISHNHYDHLDYHSVKGIIANNPHVTIFVPLGLKRKIEQWGAPSVIELDWFETFRMEALHFTAMPAKHWSSRGIKDTNQSLWCSWVVESDNNTICFLGDTGYESFFKEFPNRFTIDMALIPIGAYAPRWFMANQHVDPEQAVQIFDDIKCKRALAIHWGVFELADDSLDEPPELLHLALAKKEISPDRFVDIKIGGSLLL